METEQLCPRYVCPRYVRKRNTNPDISEKKTWNSQVTDLIYLKESDTVMALCDQ